jgi:hypothetical protein
MNEINRREWERVTSAQQIAYEYFNGQGDKVDSGNAHTVNISGRGALVEMPHACDLNASLILWITNPLQTMLIRGDIIHSRRADDGSFHVGVRLVDMIVGNWEGWEKLIKSKQEDYYEG